jgi:hypothetical protein
LVTGEIDVTTMLDDDDDDEGEQMKCTSERTSE